MSLVEHTVDGAVHMVTLVDPARRNALTWPMLGELAAIVAAIGADPSARAVVLCGDGPSFCSGADLDDVFGDLPDEPASRRAYLKQVYAGFLGLRDLAVPTVAAVDGAAVGAGLNVALACDIIVASARARFVPSFAEIGLHPGGGCSYFLAERVGVRRATAMLLVAQPVSAQDAYRMGLVEYVVEDSPSHHAAQVATTIAARAPELARSIKRTVGIAARSDLATTVEIEAWCQAESLDSPVWHRYLSQRSGRTQ